MIIPLVFWLVPIASVVALGMAFFFFRQMMGEDEGTLECAKSRSMFVKVLWHT